MLVEIKYGEQVREAIQVIFNWLELVFNFLSQVDVENGVVWYLKMYTEVRGSR